MKAVCIALLLALVGVAMATPKIKTVTSDGQTKSSVPLPVAAPAAAADPLAEALAQAAGEPVMVVEISSPADADAPMFPSGPMLMGGPLSMAEDVMPFSDNMRSSSSISSSSSSSSPHGVFSSLMDVLFGPPVAPAPLAMPLSVPTEAVDIAPLLFRGAGAGKHSPEYSNGGAIMLGGLDGSSQDGGHFGGGASRIGKVFNRIMKMLHMAQATTNTPQHAATDEDDESDNDGAQAVEIEVDSSSSSDDEDSDSDDSSSSSDSGSDDESGDSSSNENGMDEDDSPRRHHGRSPSHWWRRWFHRHGHHGRHGRHGRHHKHGYGHHFPGAHSLRKACKKDVKRLCKTEKKASGFMGVVRCFVEKSAQLSRGCAAQLKQHRAFLCAPDATRLCPQARTRHDIKRCLKDNRSALSAPCQQALQCHRRDRHHAGGGHGRQDPVVVISDLPTSGVALPPLSADQVEVDDDDDDTTATPTPTPTTPGSSNGQQPLKAAPPIAVLQRNEAYHYTPPSSSWWSWSWSWSWSGLLPLLFVSALLMMVVSLVALIRSRRRKYAARLTVQAPSIQIASPPVVVV